MDNNNKVNIKDTYEIYEITEDFIRVKECYANVGRTVLSLMKDNDKYKDYKVIYGAWSIGNLENYYARHCYLRNGKGEVVDTTGVVLGVDFANTKYIDFFEYTIEEYLEELSKANLDTSLGYDMMIKTNKLVMEYYEKGIIIMG